MICPNCGTDAGSSKFCTNCGTPLQQPSQQPQQTAQQPVQPQQPQQTVQQPVQPQQTVQQPVQQPAQPQQTQQYVPPVYAQQPAQQYQQPQYQQRPAYQQPQQQYRPAQPAYQNYAQPQQQYSAPQNGGYNVNPYSAQYNSQAYTNHVYSGEGAVVEDFNLFTAYGSMFKKFAKFSGRSRRKEYWLANIMNAIIMMIFSIVFNILAAPYVEPLMRNLYYIADGYSLDDIVFPAPSLVLIIMSVIYLVYSLILIIPSLALLVRRFHDTGKSGAAIFLWLIPFIGGLIVFIFTVMDSTPGPNKYGPNPKGVWR